VSSRILVLALLALLLPASASGAPLAAGGDSIATAVSLPLDGGLVVATAPEHAGVQFWKVDLAAQEMLVVVFGYVSGPLNDTGICVLPPATTDAALAQTHCLATLPDIHWTGGGRTQVVMVAPTSGTYYVAAGLADCLRAAAPDAVKPCGAAPALAYQLGGEVLKFTSLSVVVPKTSKAKKAVRITGVLTGAPAGVTVDIGIKGPRGSFAQLPVAADGHFALKTKALPRGRYTVNVEYAGDTSHRPQTRTATLVVR
jgi:hypothetical protein